MRKWMRDRMKRRKERKQGESAGPGPAPLQPTFLDREPSQPEAEEQAGIRESGGQEAYEAPDAAGPHGARESSTAESRQTEYESQPETDSQDQPAQGRRRERSRRRGRGGRSRQGAKPERQEKPAAGSTSQVLPIGPGQLTGEAAEVALGAEAAQPEAETPKLAAGEKGKPRGAVVLAIGLPGSGKSSWFKRHNIIPLSSDLVRGLLFDDPTEQRYQDLVFSSLRSLLRARLISGRPMNYIDATNLSPKERHSWIKMARDFGYEAHAVFFDVPAEVCMDRNRRRSRNVPDEVMLRMGQKLRPPKFEEGFAKIIVVRLKRSQQAAPAAEEEEPDMDSAAAPDFGTEE